MAYSDFYHTEKKLTAAYANLANDDFLEENKQVIRSFLATKRLQGIKALREIKLLSHLRAIGRATNKPFKELTTDDCKQLMANFLNDKFAEDTRRDYAVVTKMLLRYAHGSEEGQTPDCIRWLKVKKPGFNHKKSDLLTAEELGAILAACDSIKKKFFVAVLYESGARIGELLTLKLKDVKQDSYGLLLSLDGKTGARTVRLITCGGSYGEYLNSHYDGKNPDAPLFYMIKTRIIDKKTNHKEVKCLPYEYPAARKMLKTLFEIAGVSLEKAHFHLFRHSRAAETKRFMPEDYQRRYFGWAHGSPMPSHYGALDGTDLDNILLSAYGKAQREAAAPDVINRVCERCHKSNLPMAGFCNACGFKLGSKPPELDVSAKTMNLLSIIQSMPNLEQTLTRLGTQQLEELAVQTHEIKTEGGIELSVESPRREKNQKFNSPKKKKPK